MLTVTIIAITFGSSLALLLALLTAFAGVFGVSKAKDINRHMKMHIQAGSTTGVDIVAQQARLIQSRLSELQRLCNSVSPPIEPNDSVIRNTMLSLITATHAMENLIQNAKSKLPPAEVRLDEGVDGSETT